ncbi:hypothetical protein [Bordetella sp. 15P40C-2]|uniref:hypothetical protein n=1 Tax=Bordetella sp. 15P40C-2 TaxID=2572246 RepID=UPI0013255C79|nr:hypothetical protein [Bordetella sp. 15P40C-2]MVW72874.1 hypothetical protein [Bordetella sp. 15P40C-2]
MKPSKGTGAATDMPSWKIKLYQIICGEAQLISPIWKLRLMFLGVFAALVLAMFVMPLLVLLVVPLLMSVFKWSAVAWAAESVLEKHALEGGDVETRKRKRAQRVRRLKRARQP